MDSGREVEPMSRPVEHSESRAGKEWVSLVLTGAVRGGIYPPEAFWVRVFVPDASVFGILRRARNGLR